MLTTAVFLILAAGKVTPMQAYFAYREDVQSPCKNAAHISDGKLVGYTLGFYPSPTAYAIIGDGCVPGILFSVDDACLEQLTKEATRAGYERIQQRIEHGQQAPHGKPKGHTLAWLFILQERATPKKPDAALLTRMRDAWKTQKLNTAAIDFALKRDAL